MNNLAKRFGFTQEQAPLGGIPTLQARQRLDDNEMAQAQLTGMFRGNPTFAREQWIDSTAHRDKAFDWAKLLDEAQLTGMWNGNPTFQREQWQDSSKLNWANHALQAELGRGNLALSRSNSNLSNSLAREKFEWDKQRWEAENMPQNVTSQMDNTMLGITTKRAIEEMQSKGMPLDRQNAWEYLTEAVMQGNITLEDRDVLMNELNMRYLTPQAIQQQERQRKPMTPLEQMQKPRTWVDNFIQDWGT